jgi:hypothetical protein
MRQDGESNAISQSRSGQLLPKSNSEAAKALPAVQSAYGKLAARLVQIACML